MSGKLENRTRRALTLNLSVKVAPIRRLFARASTQRDGSVVKSDRRLVFPDSITILAGKSSESLPDHVVSCTEVANALTRGDLRWTEDAVAAAAPAADTGDATRVERHGRRERPSTT